MHLTNIELGKIGEDLAASYLQGHGYVILGRNWRSARVELDIIARDKNTLVFCEVKTRRSISYGYPSEAITALKLAHIRTAALHWLTHNRSQYSGVRFDVVSVLYCHDENSRITHIKGLD